MRAEAISGTNLFGYKERQNTSDNEEFSLSDAAEDTKRGRDVPTNPAANSAISKRLKTNSNLRDNTSNSYNRSRNTSRDRVAASKTENEQVLKNARQKKKLVETPAFGTKTRGFFKDNVPLSDSSIDDKLQVGGFQSPALQSRVKKLKGSLVEPSTNSTTKLVGVSNANTINNSQEAMASSTKKSLQDKIRPQSRQQQ